MWGPLHSRAVPRNKVLDAPPADDFIVGQVAAAAVTAPAAAQAGLARKNTKVRPVLAICVFPTILVLTHEWE